MKSEEIIFQKLSGEFPIQQKNIFCAQGKEAIQACFKYNCNKSAFVCKSKGCKCKQEHRSCLRLFGVKNISAILQQKLLPFRKIGLLIQEQIHEAIDELSQLQEKLKNNLQDSLVYKSFSDTEKLVIEALKTGKGNQVKGKHIYQIQSGIDHKAKNRIHFLEENISKCWNKYGEDFRILTSSINDYFLTKNKMHFLRESSILKTEEDVNKMINFFTKQIQTTQLLFRASRDSFKSQQFHTKCNGMANTLTIIETSASKIIGGFTPCEWNSNDPDGQDSTDSSRESFVFQFNNNEKFTLKKKSIANAICNNPNYGPIFGAGNDILISNEADTNSKSHANIGYSYQNASYIYENANSRTKFSGTQHFIVKDYEVWKTTFK